jgi:hypothetical protein
VVSVNDINGTHSHGLAQCSHLRQLLNRVTTSLHPTCQASNSETRRCEGLLGNTSLIFHQRPRPINCRTLTPAIFPEVKARRSNTRLAFASWTDYQSLPLFKFMCSQCHGLVHVCIILQERAVTGNTRTIFQWHINRRNLTPLALSFSPR